MQRPALQGSDLGRREFTAPTSAPQVAVTSAFTITRWKQLRRTTGARALFESFDMFRAALASPVIAGEKTALPGWSPALFEGDRRKKSGAETFGAVVVEHDAGCATVERAAEVFGGWRGAIYTTHSHTLEAPRFRVVIALREPRPAAEYPRAWEHLARVAADAGVPLDPACKDVSRLWYWPGAPAERAGLYQLVALEGEPLDVEALPVEAEGLFAARAGAGVGAGGSASTQPTEPSAAPRPVSLARENARRSARKGAPVLALANATLPPELETGAIAIGAAIRDHGEGGRHRCFLWLVAALIDRHFPIAHIPAFIARAAAVDVGWESKHPDRLAGVRTTLDRIAAGEKVAGYGALRDAYPAVADAFDRALEALDSTKSAPVALRVRALLDESGPELVSIEDALARAAKAIDEARPFTITVLAMPPGTGKTQLFIRYANSLPPILPNEDGQARAKSGQRVGLTVPTTALAMQVAAGARSAMRFFSPVSLLDANGVPVCKYAGRGRALAEGGLSVRWEFCEGRGEKPCEYFDGCAAAECREGDNTANLVVGTHELVGAVRAKIGAYGTLGLDEPREPLFAETITLADLATARRLLPVFGNDYVRKMRPALFAYEAWLERVGEVVESDGESPLVSVPDAIRAGASEVPDSVLEAAGIDPTAGAAIGDLILREALFARVNEKKEPTREPPFLRRVESHRARVQDGRAQEIKPAVRVLRLLRQGLLGREYGAPFYAGRITEQRGERTVNLIGVNEAFADAMLHEGPIVVLDANASLLMHVLDGVRPTVNVLEFGVRDGARIQRTIIATNRAKFRWALPHGVPDWNVILPMLRAILAWLAEDPSTKIAALFCPKEVEAPIAYALRPDAPATRELIEEARAPRKTLEAAAALLRPMLETWPGELLTGHYGALRGLDTWKHADATVTLIDPRPNLGVEFEKALYLATDATGRIDAIARAELQQAHGRLRTIHRTKPGRQLHVGSLAPAGWNGPNGRRVEVRGMPVGRPRQATAMTAAELRGVQRWAGLTVAALAERLGLGARTLPRYLSGERPVPAQVAAAARNLLPGLPETPVAEPLEETMADQDGASSQTLPETPVSSSFCIGVSGSPSWAPATGVSGRTRDAVAGSGDIRVNAPDVAPWADGDEDTRGAA